MKKAKYYLLLALVVIMSGCDDFLEKNPPSKPSENTFWKQKSDFGYGSDRLLRDNDEI